MMRYLRIILILLCVIATTFAQQGILCPGPDGTAYSETQGACVNNPSTSCDSVGKTTCVYANLVGGGYLGGVLDERTGIFTIGHTGPIPDIQKGDQLRAMGAASAKRLTNVRTSGSLTKYTKTRPARSLRLRVFRPKTGTWLTVTWRP